MRTLSYTDLPRTNDPRQVFTVDVTVDGVALHARVELRYLSAPDRWVISIWDHATSVLLINQIPLVCSYSELNDLLLPFRYLRDGAGMGSLFVLRNKDETVAADPSRDSLTEFSLLWLTSALPGFPPQVADSASPIDGLPDAVHISEADLKDAPAFAGGAVHGSPPLMILYAAVSGWRPGQTVEVDYKDVRDRGIITERSVDADTGFGPWKSEMIVELRHP